MAMSNYRPVFPWQYPAPEAPALPPVNASLYPPDWDGPTTIVNEDGSVSRWVPPDGTFFNLGRSIQDMNNMQNSLRSMLQGDNQPFDVNQSVADMQSMRSRLTGMVDSQPAARPVARPVARPAARPAARPSNPSIGYGFRESDRDWLIADAIATDRALTEMRKRAILNDIQQRQAAQESAGWSPFGTTFLR